MKASKLVVLGLLIILSLAIAACGGTPQTAPPPTATDAPPTATTEPEPSATEPPTEPAPAATNEAEPTATAEPELEATEEPEATAEAEPAGDATAGEAHFTQVCAACHGPGGEGIAGLGKDLTTSEFVASLDDAELLEFISTGRPVDHPDNTTGVAMPPRGGNPDFTDAQLMDIIAYIRTLQEQ